MTSPPSTPSRRAIVILGAITALVIGCIAVLVVLRGGSQTETNLHRQTWLARPFANYEMEISIDDGFGMGQCRNRYKVQDEQVQNVITDSPEASCAQEAYSVSELFAEIEADQGCGPNGCACDGPIRAVAEYDPTLGYPTRISIEVRPQDRWRYVEYWRQQVPFIGGGGCTLIGFIGSTIEVLSLTPLP